MIRQSDHLPRYILTLLFVLILSSFFLNFTYLSITFITSTPHHILLNFLNYYRCLLTYLLQFPNNEQIFKLNYFHAFPFLLLVMHSNSKTCNCNKQQFKVQHKYTQSLLSILQLVVRVLFKFFFLQTV